MRYELYTTVDITNTGRYRPGDGPETDRWKEQNFQTVLLTLGIRSNVSFADKPKLLEINGRSVGFEVNGVINVWHFEFDTERDNLFENNDNPVGYLLEDFDAVPYINGLDESMEQNYNVFVTEGPARNIVFNKK